MQEGMYKLAAVLSDSHWLELEKSPCKKVAWRIASLTDCIALESLIIFQKNMQKYLKQILDNKSSLFHVRLSH